MKPKKTLESLLKEYKVKETDQSFNELYRATFEKSLPFLLMSGISFDDAEDILQEYFSKDFYRSIETFDMNCSSSFFNYVKRILKYRLIHSIKSPYKTRCFPVDCFFEPIAVFDNYFETLDESTILKIKSFLSNIVFSIKNINHRNSVIVKLSLPFIKAEIISFLLDMPKSTYNSYIYRGIKELKSTISKSELHTFGFTEEDLMIFIMDGFLPVRFEYLLLSFDYEMIKDIKAYLTIKEINRKLKENQREPLLKIIFHIIDERNFLSW